MSKIAEGSGLVLTHCNPRPDPKATKANRLRILLLEDNPADAELVRYQLRRAGIAAETVRVATREEFEARLDPCPDAILCDYHVPAWNGLQALHLVRERGLDIPFIIVSGTIGEDVAVETIRHGADDYLLKDRLSRLGPALINALERKRQRDAARRAAEALREREAGLHRAQIMARLAHIVVDSRGNFVTWSETLPPMIGLDRASMPGSTRKWLQLIHADDRAGFVAMIIEAERTGLRLEFEYRVKHAAGNWVHLQQVLEPIAEHAAADGTTRWFNTLQDVTEHKLAAAALRESEEKYHTLIDAMNEGVGTQDANGLITFLNRRACEMFGYERDELIGKPTTFLLDEENREIFRQQMTQRAKGGRQSYELAWMRKDGGRIDTLIAPSPRFDAQGALLGSVAVFTDITERKQAELRIRRLNRVHAVLSGINALIVRVRDRDELFREACRIAVEQGGFRLAWLGVVDRAAMRVKPVAWHGVDESFIQSIPQVLDGPAASPVGLTVRAVREKKAMVSNDIGADARIALRAESLERGLHSVAVLPLIVAGEVAGLLGLATAQSEFFDADEMKLLDELAGDIGFALDHIEKAGRLDYLAFYDPLTGLPNHALFIERVQQAVREAGQAGRKAAVVNLDVERLRAINESYGRHAGDAVLKHVAQRLSAAAGERHAGRVSADQFALILPAVAGRSEALRLIKKMCEDCLSQPLELNGADVRLSAKIGIAMFPANGTEAEMLIANAETALMDGKRRSQPVSFYSAAMRSSTAESMTLENQLRLALEREEFVLHYQPKVDFETRAIVGVEALIRWQSPERGLVPPFKFIPLLEKTGLILPVGAWALRKAAQDHRAWTEQKLRPPRVAVNVSAVQLRQRDFVSTVEQAIIEGVAPTGIDLEITESLVMEDVQGTIEKLKALGKLGVKVAIDDFGTGYSSLAYLAKLPVQMLKIDRAFVVSMLEDADTMAMVQTVITLAHSLRLIVVAEGVEEEAQAKVLRLLRCDQMQGYLFSRPLPLDQITALLRQ